MNERALKERTKMTTGEREMTYQIESKDGTIYGEYQGNTPEQAFAAMVADGMGDTDTAGTADDWIITPVSGE